MKKLVASPFLLVHWSLYLLIVLLIVGMGFGLYATHRVLLERVAEVDHLRIDSDLNQQSIENARRLRITLDKNKESVARAAAIVADTKYYEYQDQIVQDTSSYASAAGLTVLGFDFTSKNTSTGTTSTIKGLNTVVATVSLKNPVPYNNYIRFLKLIERNLTKMQVTELDISNDLKVPGSITSPVITIEVYVR